MLQNKVDYQARVASASCTAGDCTQKLCGGERCSQRL